MPQAITGRLIGSMRRRCLACLAATGGLTRYWDFREIDVLTLTKLQVKFKSRDSLKSVLVMINVSSKNNSNAIT